jgi:hypothetical protein
MDKKICNVICSEGSPMNKRGICSGEPCNFHHGCDKNDCVYQYTCCFECRFLHRGCTLKNYLNETLYFKFILLYKNGKERNM